MLHQVLDCGGAGNRADVHSATVAGGQMNIAAGLGSTTIGGGGEKVTLRLTAKHADIWHGFGKPEELAHKNAVLDGWCAKLGRDPAMGSSVMITAVTDSGGFFIFLGLATLFLL